MAPQCPVVWGRHQPWLNSHRAALSQQHYPSLCFSIWSLKQINRNYEGKKKQTCLFLPFLPTFLSPLSPCLSPASSSSSPFHLVPFHFPLPSSFPWAFPFISCLAWPFSPFPLSCLPFSFLSFLLFSFLFKSTTTSTQPNLASFLSSLRSFCVTSPV